MGIFDRFPYSSTHEMNLDFMLGKATEIAEDMQTVATGMAQVQAGLSAISDKTEQATQAAAAAAQSASSIEGSVTAAEEAAEEAQRHNESAQTWANNAMTYKADCQRSATEAAASSSSAAQAATAAAASEDTVAQYAQAANASAQSAANNNDSAHQYANQASASASNATFHSSNAQTAATNANTSATNAQTAATNAQTAATRASALKDDCQTLHSMCTKAVDLAAEQAVAAANSAAQAAATKTDVENLVESLPEDFTDLNNTVNQLSDEIDNVRDTEKYATGCEKIAFVQNKIIESGTSPVIISNPYRDYNGWSCAIVECSEGDVFNLTAQGGTLAKSYAFTKSDGEIIESSHSEFNGINIIAPAETAYAVFNSINTHSTLCYKGESLISKVGNMAEYVYSGIKKMYVGNIHTGVTSELTGSYYYRSGENTLQTTPNSRTNAFIFDVFSHNQTFVGNKTMVVVLLDSYGVPLRTTTNSFDYTNVKTFNSGEADKIALGYYADEPGTFVLSQGDILNTAPVEVAYYANTEKEIQQNGYSKTTGNLASGDSFTLSGRSSVKDGVSIVFNSLVSSFDTLKIDFVGGASANYVSISNTTIEVKHNNSAAQTFEHGLTIQNDISILLQIVDGKINISVCSNGNQYKQTNIPWYQTGGVMSEPKITSTNTICANAVFAIVYGCIDRDIWYFGDSYIEFNDSNRLPYVLQEYSLQHKMLMNGTAGCSSASTTQAFATLLQHGKPKYAVFATGMNDGSDSTAASTTFTNNAQSFIDTCEVYGITPILCTIPTVPTVNNELKNAWVKAKGLRYIDYASAVGANASGVWFSGMLSNDNVHPTTAGSRALFFQLLSDLPEILE